MGWPAMLAGVRMAVSFARVAESLRCMIHAVGTSASSRGRAATAASRNGLLGVGSTTPVLRRCKRAPARAQAGGSALAARALAARRQTLPALVHPPPLLGMSHHHPLERLVVRAGVAADLLVRILGRKWRQCRLEAEDVSAIRFAPARSGDDRRAGGQRNDREASERAGSMPEELDLDAVRTPRVLVEREHDRVVLLEQPEHVIEGAALADRAEARLAHAAIDQRIEPRGLDVAAHEMDPVAHFGELREPRERAHLEIAEVAGEDEDALVLRPCFPEGLDAFDAHQRALASRRMPSIAHELAQQA